VCPICKGKLHVSISIHTSKYWGRYLSVGVRCESCDLSIFTQSGAEAIPPWAKESEYNNMSPEEVFKLAGLLGNDSQEQ
jgi:C4-type Zn-finger protein